MQLIQFHIVLTIIHMNSQREYSKDSHCYQQQINEHQNLSVMNLLDKTMRHTVYIIIAHCIKLQKKYFGNYYIHVKIYWMFCQELIVKHFN